MHVPGQKIKKSLPKFKVRDGDVAIFPKNLMTNIDLGQISELHPELVQDTILEWMKSDPNNFTTDKFEVDNKVDTNVAGKTFVDRFDIETNDKGVDFIKPHIFYDMNDPRVVSKIESQIKRAPSDISHIKDYNIFDETVNTQPVTFNTKVSGRKVDDTSMTGLIRLNGLKNLKDLERDAIISTASAMNDPESTNNPYETALLSNTLGHAHLRLPTGLLSYNSDMDERGSAIHELIHAMNRLVNIANPDYFEPVKGYGNITVFKGDVPALDALVKLSDKIGGDVDVANDMMRDVYKNDITSLAKFKIESIFFATLLPYIMKGATRKQLEDMRFDPTFKEPLSRVGSGYHGISYLFNPIDKNDPYKKIDNKYVVWNMMDELRATYGEAIAAGGGAKVRSHIASFSDDMNERMKLVIQMIPPESRQRVKNAVRELHRNKVSKFIPGMNYVKLGGLVGLGNVKWNAPDNKQKMDLVRQIIIDAVTNGKVS